MSKYSEQAIKIMHDPTTSDWLRDAVYAASKRDMLDAYHDAVALANLLSVGLEEIGIPVMTFGDNHENPLDK